MITACALVLPLLIAAAIAGLVPWSLVVAVWLTPAAWFVIALFWEVYGCKALKFFMSRR